MFRIHAKAFIIVNLTWKFLPQKSQIRRRWPPRCWLFTLQHNKYFCWFYKYIKGWPKVWNTQTNRFKTYHNELKTLAMFFFLSVVCSVIVWHTSMVYLIYGGGWVVGGEESGSSKHFKKIWGLCNTMLERLSSIERICKSDPKRTI